MNIEFIENKNKIDLDIKLLMEDMINNVYDEIINYYKENNINDIILIDKRLDIIRNKLINTKLLKNNKELKEGYIVYAISKNIEYSKKGIIDTIEENSIILKKEKDLDYLE